MKSEKAKGGPLIPQRPVFCAKREKGTGQRRLSRAFFDVEKDEVLLPEKIEAIQVAVGLGILVETHSYADPAQREALIAAGVRMFHTAAPEETLEWLRGKGYR